MAKIVVKTKRTGQNIISTISHLENNYVLIASKRGNNSTF